jgi:hypothetical protein
MAISMHLACVPTVTRALSNLIAILEKGAAHCEAKKIDPAVMIASRLYPDMFPLAKQVQIASDISKIGSSRLAGVEFPKWEDNEASFADLVQRLRKTVDYLQTLKPEQFEGSETRTIKWTAQGTDFAQPGAEYLFNRVLPNVFFHCSTAYDILRHNGVELGKGDFLGKS